MMLLRRVDETARFEFRRVVVRAWMLAVGGDISTFCYIPNRPTGFWLRNHLTARVNSSSVDSRHLLKRQFDIHKALLGSERKKDVVKDSFRPLTTKTVDPRNLLPSRTALPLSGFAYSL
ncbi:hypothetical protein TWF481_002480 [Arthrobotrys musiformis]|uniref:Uncharacterized protein n=1 Tax=Arthrobotrys musiformis TaxID=47236 RepID=A0AAV9VTG8_9PEZI